MQAQNLPYPLLSDTDQLLRKSFGIKARTALHHSMHMREHWWIYVYSSRSYIVFCLHSLLQVTLCSGALRVSDQLCAS